ncbi:MAG TPA: DUF1573 domain-containing protein [Thermoanaerobaculia bacterium]|nr:DUF1573 domain-containing protein [Thermoanaerobaculia bacterium]
MSDDFSTVSSKRGERAREIELLRQQYRKHREALVAMIAEAPSEHLATEYQKLIREIDVAMGKIDELEGRSPAARPLVPPPAAAEEPEYVLDEEPPANGSRSRVAMIVGAGLIVLAIIVYLIWRASSDRPGDVAATTTTAPITESTAPVTPAAVPEVVKLLTVAPTSADYGTIRKGTRATRQFEVTNNSEEPVSIQVGRSQCRCLYYEHAEAVAPKGKETITVTIDGARAKAGALAETLKVSSKKDPTNATTFEVRATIR